MMNPKKLYRLSREEGLTVRRRGGRKRATGTRAPITLPPAADQHWSLDLVADVLSWDGVPVLAIVDDFTREALALVVDTSIASRQVVGELDALIAFTPPPADRQRQRHRTDLAGPSWNGPTGPAPFDTASRLESQLRTPWRKA
jgi:transposase InsO family protein